MHSLYFYIKADSTHEDVEIFVGARLSLKLSLLESLRELQGFLGLI